MLKHSISDVPTVGEGAAKSVLPKWLFLSSVQRRELAHLLLSLVPQPLAFS